jgi:hypothetical protein
MPFAETAAGAPARFQPTPAESCSPPAFDLAPHPCVSPAGEWLRLTDAIRALWTATLALMTAFMQVPAPAHRYLLAQRISCNLDTLAALDCFDPGCRDRFARLARRWRERALEYAPQRSPARLRLRLRDLLF